MKTVLMVIILGIVAVGALFVGYKFYNRQLRLAPAAYNTSATPNLVPNGSALPSNSGNVTLNIESPSDGQTVDTATIVVNGVTVPNAEVFVNEFETVADNSGKFSATVNLDDGENVITVTANDENGNFSEKDLTVIYNSGT